MKFDIVVYSESFEVNLILLRKAVYLSLYMKLKFGFLLLMNGGL
jgi:hypothetical protein